MAQLQQELSSLEVEPLEIVMRDPGREGFDTPLQGVSLETFTTQSDVESDALLTGVPLTNKHHCCCVGLLACFLCVAC